MFIISRLVYNVQDIFTFRRLSVFTVSFTRNLQVLMHCTVLLASQVVLVQSLQPKGPEFESTKKICLCIIPLYLIRLTSLL